jgi:iron complex outermembrane receptor protein
MNKKLIAMSAVSLVLSTLFAKSGYAEDAQVTAPVEPVANETKAVIGKESTADDQPPQELKEMVVTATRSAKVVSDAPATVTVVTSKQLESRNVKRVDDAVSNTAGVYVKGQGDGMPSNYNNQIVMRGIPGYYRTAVMLDGQLLNDGFSGGVNISTVPAETIEQIEVVPGPFSSLYGGSAMGGVINIITRKPTKQEFILSGSIGSNDTKKETVVYRNKLNDMLGIALNYNHAQSAGYVNDMVTYTGTTTASPANTTGATTTTDSKGNPVYLVGDKGKKGWHQDNAGIKLYLDADPQNKLTFDYGYTNIAMDYQDSYNCYLSQSCTASRVINDNGVNKTLAVKEIGFLNAPNGEKTNRYATSYEHMFDVARLKVDMGYKKDDYWYVQTNSSAPASTLSGGNGSYSDLPSSRLDLSATLNFPLGMHYLTLGVFTNRNELNKKNYTLSNWRDVDSKGSVYYTADGDTNSRAAAIQDEYAFNDRFTLYAGGRYDTWSTSGHVTQSIQSGYTTAAFDNTYASRSSSFFSPKLSAVYKLAGDTTLRGAWGRAFRAPSLSEMYSTSGSITGSKTSTSQANANLKPETSTSWEIGVDHKFNTGTQLRATYYETELDDLLYTVTIVDTTTQKTSEWQNVGKAKTKGLELELRQPVTSGLTTFVNVTSGSSVLTSVTDATLVSYVGQQLKYIPKRMANVGLEGARGFWSGSILGHYASKAYADDKNLDTVNGVYGSTDPYFIVNAKLGYAISKSVSISFSVDNLTDRTYYQYSRMPGRTETVGLTGKF